LILTAPFWQLGEWWQRGIGLLLKPFLRRIRPFKKVDFADPQVQHGISNFLPDVDLDDPDVQTEIRDLAIPTRIFEQLIRVGNEAYRLAPQIDVPTLIVQGTQDETVPARRTRRLLQQLPGPVRYEETATGHDLIRADDPGWPDVRRAVVSFSRTLLDSFSKN
jgi:pimeloyl-ACP methyl ester carboxylesterase